MVTNIEISKHNHLKLNNTMIRMLLFFTNVCVFQANGLWKWYNILQRDAERWNTNGDYMKYGKLETHKIGY